MKLNKIDRSGLINSVDKSVFFPTAMFEITSNCNLQCVHCYNDIDKEEKDFDFIKLIVDKLSDLGVVFISLTGGESLLHKDFQKIYLYLKQKGFVTTVYSNGVLLNRYIDLFRTMKPNMISISLYGLEEEGFSEFTLRNGKFKQFDLNLSLLLENEIDFILKVLVTKNNFDAVLQGKYDQYASCFDAKVIYTYDIIPTKTRNSNPLKYRIDAHQASELLMWLNAKRSERISYDAIVRKSPISFRCNGGLSSIHVNNLGKISICMMDQNSTYDFNVPTVELTKLLKERSKAVNSLAKDMECYNCKINYRCTWCPPALNYVGDLNNNSFLCNTQGLFVSKLEFENVF